MASLKQIFCVPSNRSYFPIFRDLNKSLFIRTTRFQSSHNVESPGKTALHDFHVNQKGKMVNFANYLLPVQYSDLSISASHLHTRKHGSIFDVSHMLQTYVRGKDSVECFESICTADIMGLKDNSGTLTVFTTDRGTILDDLIVSKISQNFLYVVSNAAMKSQDMIIMQEAVDRFKSKGKDVNVEFITPDERSLVAVQGPEAVETLQKLTKANLKQLYFMTTTESEVAGVANCRITRCGYTGEDGVEISVPSSSATQVVNALLECNGSNLKLAGLGARDSLRLEAGLCLYGSDIDTSTTPVEGALTWLVAKRRRAEENFPGAGVINEQIKNGVEKRRVGFRLFSGPPARHGVGIYKDGEAIGSVTSGCPSPSLGGSVGMGYVKECFKKAGTKIDLKIRDKFYSTELTKMPFVPAKYYVK